MSDSFNLPSTSSIHTNNERSEQQAQTNAAAFPLQQQQQTPTFPFQGHQQYPFQQNAFMGMAGISGGMKNNTNNTAPTNLGQSLLNIDAFALNPNPGSGFPNLNMNQFLSGPEINGLYDTMNLQSGSDSGLQDFFNQQQRLQQKSSAPSATSNGSPSPVVSGGIPTAFSASSVAPNLSHPQSPTVSSPQVPNALHPSQTSHTQSLNLIGRTPSIDGNMANFAFTNFASAPSTSSAISNTTATVANGTIPEQSPPNMSSYISPSPIMNPGSITSQSASNLATTSYQNPSSSNISKQDFSPHLAPLNSSLPTSQSQQVNLPSMQPHTLSQPRNQQELAMLQHRIMMQRNQQLQLQQQQQQLLQRRSSSENISTSMNQSAQQQQGSQSTGQEALRSPSSFQSPGSGANSGMSDDQNHTNNSDQLTSPRLGSLPDQMERTSSQQQANISISRRNSGSVASNTPPSVQGADLSTSGQSAQNDLQQTSGSLSSNAGSMKLGSQFPRQNQNMFGNLNNNNNNNAILMQQLLHQQQQAQLMKQFQQKMMMTGQLSGMGNSMINPNTSTVPMGQMSMNDLALLSGMGLGNMPGLNPAFGNFSGAGVNMFGQMSGIPNATGIPGMAGMTNIGGIMGGTAGGIPSLTPENMRMLGNTNMMSNMPGLTGSIPLQGTAVSAQDQGPKNPLAGRAQPGITVDKESENSSQQSQQALNAASATQRSGLSLQAPAQQRQPMIPPTPVQLPDRTQWEALFMRSLKQRNIVWSRTPILAGRPIDFYSLFCSTILEGGYKTISSVNGWRAVARRMEYGNTSNAPTILKKHYGNYLIPLENLLYPHLSQVNSALVGQKGAGVKPVVRPSPPALGHPLSQQPAMGQIPGIMRQAPSALGNIRPPLQLQAQPIVVDSKVAGSMPHRPPMNIQHPSMQPLSSAVSPATINTPGTAGGTPSHQPGSPSELSNSQSSAPPLPIPNHPSAVSTSISPSVPPGILPIAVAKAKTNPPPPKRPKPAPPPRKVLPVIKFPSYVPKSRRVISFGGLDLDRLAPALQRPRPIKEQYGRLDPKRYALHLASGSDIQIRYTLDALLNYSAEFHVKFGQYPELLNQILIRTKLIVSELCPDLTNISMKHSDKEHANVSAISQTTDQIDTQDKTVSSEELKEASLISNSSKKRKRALESYAELYDDELERHFTLRSGAQSMFNRETQLIEDLCVLSMILRNASFVPENAIFMARQDGMMDVVFWLLNLPKDRDDDTHSMMNKDDQPEYDSLRVFVRPPSYQALEHRKNMLVILANLGFIVRLPNVNFAQCFLDIASDFLAETKLYYVYPALEALSKIFLITENQDMLPSLQRIPLLLERLWKLLPVTGWEVESMTPSDFVRYEFVTMNLLAFLTAGTSDLINDLAEKPGFLSLLLRLSRLPSSFSEDWTSSSGTGLSLYKRSNSSRGATHMPSQQVANEFSVLCERSMRILLECARTSDGAREWLNRHEDQLMEISIIAEQKRDAELAKLTANVLFELNAEDHV